MTGGTGARAPLTAHLWVWQDDTREWVRTASGGPGEMRRASNAVRATLRALALDVAVQVSEWTPIAPPATTEAAGETTTEWAVALHEPGLPDAYEVRRDEADARYALRFYDGCDAEVVTRTIGPWRPAPAP